MTDSKDSDKDGWITEVLPTPEFFLNKKEGSILFLQTGQGKFNKFQVIDGEYVFVGTVE